MRTKILHKRHPFVPSKYPNTLPRLSGNQTVLTKSLGSIIKISPLHKPLDLTFQFLHTSPPQRSIVNPTHNSPVSPSLKSPYYSCLDSHSFLTFLSAAS